jgi:hypothetical protein
MISLIIPPAGNGTAASPLPTTRLRSRPGWRAAANRAAAVPVPGATTCGYPSPNASAIVMMNSPIACGDSSASLRWECPSPGRSTATS